MDYRALVFPVWWAVMMFASLRNIHMLQLSSYQTPGYFRWIKTHVPDIFSCLVWAIPVLLIEPMFSYWGLPANGVHFACVFFFLCCAAAAHPIQKAKKPMVFTGRVIRLLVMQTVVFALPLLLFHVLWDVPRVLYILMGVFLMALPLFVLVANVCCLPIQKLINNRYIRDAQKMLRAHPGLTIIGVTGSYGKTSVKVFLQRLLSVKYNTLATPESYNTPMGVVRTVREKLRATDEIFVCEMGARHKGDIKELCDIVHPDIGVITSVGPQHLETFKTLETVIETKFELADALKPDSLLFVNMGSEPARRGRVLSRVVYYGAADKTPRDVDLDYRARDIRTDRAGLHFTVDAGGESMDFDCRLLGRHNVENLTAAIAVAHRMGLPLSALKPAVASIQPVAHRLQLRPHGELIIIDDAFNANPEGAAAALEALGEMDGLRVLITPGFVELGDRQEELLYQLGQQACAVCHHVFLVGEKQTLSIRRGLLEAGFDETRVSVEKTFEDAMKKASALASGHREKFVLIENDLPDQY